jgi:hypothetical protein
MLMLLFCTTFVHAQIPIGIGTKYNNSFREWVITTDDEEVEGSLRMRWSFGDDWTAWDFDIGEFTAASIRNGKMNPISGKSNAMASLSQRVQPGLGSFIVGN